MQKHIKKNAQWQRLRATAVLLLSVAAIPPAWPAAADNEATLNFVGADIESVIKAIGHYTNTTFIIDPRVKGTINLVAETALTKAQAFNLLGSALRLQGYAMVAGDGFTKVVPEADAKLQATPTEVRSDAVRLKGDQIGTRIFRLNYESAGNLVAVLRPLISPNNTINANPGNNSLVITDYADNLNRLGKIITALDAPATGDMDVVPVRYAIAADIAVMINKLLESGAAAPGTDAGRVNLIADSRTNAVIVRAPSLARANLAKSLIAKLDQPTAQPGNVHVVYLKNADATKLALTLRSVVGSDGSAPSSTTPASAPAATQNTANGMTGSMPPSAAPAVLSSGGPAGFIQADTATNTLIITASEPVYRNLRTVIDQLDVRRAQVYIESLIVEVTADKAAEFGIQWLGLSGNSGSSYRVGGGSAFAGSVAGDNILNLATGNGAVAPGAGLTLGIFRQINGKLGLGALARALESDADTNILSTPNLITLDNEEAKIIVGQNVPFITGQYTTQASGGGAGVNPFQTIERKDVGLSLRVRPQISEGGTVKMAIYQETSAVQSTANTAGIITSKRSIETNVLADDGQIIVLGGLIEDTVGDSAEKVPGLGDIPVIGNLFKYQKRSRKKTNLMVFLRPTVIRSSEQSASVVADRYDYIRGTEIAAQPARTIFLPDTGAPILPLLESGQPIGGSFLKPLQKGARPDANGNGNGGASIQITPATPAAESR
ncbi:MAG: type II secretion system secretin GspD [Glaciimonas sp.]|nr:type II secretion system secretin GspD [Glaciimonas sp.]